MYRYQGNTGRYVRVPDQTPQSRPQQRHQQAAPRPAPPPEQRSEPAHKAAPPMNTGGGLNALLSGVLPDGFEMEDALLLLILFLMYRETGDKELLIIMGAMFLL